MKEKMQRLENGYLVVDIAIVWCIIAFAKGNVERSLFLLAIVVIVWYITMYHHGTKVINRYNGNVFVKGEDGDEVFAVPSGDMKNHVDGVKVNGKVYKLPDGVRATITKNGKVFVSSVFGYLVYKVCGGELGKAPDPSWDKLLCVEG